MKHSVKLSWKTIAGYTAMIGIIALYWVIIPGLVGYYKPTIAPPSGCRQLTPMEAQNGKSDTNCPDGFITK